MVCSLCVVYRSVGGFIGSKPSSKCDFSLKSIARVQRTSSDLIMILPDCWKQQPQPDRDPAHAGSLHILFLWPCLAASASRPCASSASDSTRVQLGIELTAMR